MSRLEELIQELCPNGVKFLPISEIGTLTRGKRFVHADAVDEGVPCIHYGEIYTYYGLSTVATKSFVREEIAPKLRYAHKNDVIIVGAGENNIDIGIGVAYLGDDEVAIHDACYILTHEMNPKYISYCLRTNDYHKQIKKYVSSGKICSISTKGIGRAVIPVPPLEVQREIVRILDHFTELTTELATELAARKKQYEYYRDQLLNRDMGFQMIELGDVCTFIRGPFGGALKKEIFEPEGFAVYEQQNAIYQNLSIRYHISSQKFDELKRFAVHSGDLIVSCSGTIGKTFVIPECAPQGVINQALLKLTPCNELNVYYLQFFFENTISKILNGVARGGAIKNVPAVKELKKIKIPLPPLEEQQRIVDILDRFDTLCNDLTAGLPAEIEARQKQYEYYRDKLLTFEPLAD